MTLRIKQRRHLLTQRVYHNNNNDVSGRHTRNKPTNKQTTNRQRHVLSLCARARARARACNNFGIGILNNNITRDLNNNSSSSCGGGAIPSPPTRPLAISIYAHTQQRRQKSSTSAHLKTAPPTSPLVTTLYPTVSRSLVVKVSRLTLQRPFSRDIRTRRIIEMII